LASAEPHAEGRARGVLAARGAAGRATNGRPACSYIMGSEGHPAPSWGVATVTNVESSRARA